MNTPSIEQQLAADLAAIRAWLTISPSSALRSPERPLRSDRLVRQCAVNTCTFIQAAPRRQSRITVALDRSIDLTIGDSPNDQRALIAAQAAHALVIAGRSVGLAEQHAVPLGMMSSLFVELATRTADLLNVEPRSALSAFTRIAWNDRVVAQLINAPDQSTAQRRLQSLATPPPGLARRDQFERALELLSS